MRSRAETSGIRVNACALRALARINQRLEDEARSSLCDRTTTCAPAVPPAVRSVNETAGEATSFSSSAASKVATPRLLSFLGARR